MIFKDVAKMSQQARWKPSLVTGKRPLPEFPSVDSEKISGRNEMPGAEEYPLHCRIMGCFAGIDPKAHPYSSNLDRLAR